MSYTPEQLKALEAAGWTKEQIQALVVAKPVVEREAPTNPPAPVAVETTKTGVVITVPEISDQHGSISKSGKGINRVNEEIVVHIGGRKLRGRLLLTEKI